jgi:hypothetical protein
VQPRADDRLRAAAVRPACRSAAAATATVTTAPQAGTGATRNSNLGCQPSPHGRPLQAVAGGTASSTCGGHGEAEARVQLVSRSVTVPLRHTGTPGSTRTGRHRIDLVQSPAGADGGWRIGTALGLDSPCRTAAPSSWPLRTRAKGSTRLSMFGGIAP